MLRRIGARIVVPFLLMFVCLAALSADEPPPPAPTAQPEQPRGFVQLFRVGQAVSLSSSSLSVDYILQLYSEKDKKEIEDRYEKELAQYQKLEKNREAVDAKGRELLQELRNAEPAQRERIIIEMRALGLAVGNAAAGRGGNRLGALTRTRPPSNVRFYRVSEIGANYIGLTRESTQMYIPVWSIRSVSREIETAKPQPAEATKK